MLRKAHRRATFAHILIAHRAHSTVDELCSHRHWRAWASACVSGAVACEKTRANLFVNSRHTGAFSDQKNDVWKNLRIIYINKVALHNKRDRCATHVPRKFLRGRASRLFIMIT